MSAPFQVARLHPDCKAIPDCRAIKCGAGPNSGCLDLQTDKKNCGACGNACDDIESCFQETCKENCQDFNLAGFQCPTGATRYCSTSRPIDPFDNNQAKEACELCYGTPCALDTGINNIYPCGPARIAVRDGCSIHYNAYMALMLQSKGWKGPLPFLRV